jgi:DNA topoisomerase-2
MRINNFLNEELVNFASYSTLRAIGSLVDGQKNAGRKILHTVQKKNIIKDIKVEILSGTVSVETEYLHGPQNLNGVIVGLAQNYIGSNNIPLLMREGNFGTRFIPEASAPRYIFTLKEPIFDKLFIKEDNEILIQQNFEGTDIEPKFFVPTLPLILINGSEGIATGFAQKILPRSTENIIEYITAYLNETELPELIPFYNGFEGSIEKSTDPLDKNRYFIKGKIERLSSTRFMITEIPIGYSLESYIKVLDSLEDKKIIKSFTDKSKDDSFLFEVQMDSKSMKNSDDWLMTKMKLVKTVTENFTVIDENNRVKSYNSPEEVINHYIKVKLEYLQKRKDYLIKKVKQDIFLNASKYLFVKGVTEETIIVNNKKKAEVITQLEPIEHIIQYEDSYEYLLRMPIYSLTTEKLEELKKKIANLKEELSTITNKTLQSTWTEEVQVFKEK